MIVIKAVHQKNLMKILSGDYKCWSLNYHGGETEFSLQRFTLASDYLNENGWKLCKCEL